MALDLTAFFAENTLSTEHVKFVASKRFVDPKTKKPMEWEIKAVSSREDEATCPNSTMPALHWHLLTP